MLNLSLEVPLLRGTLTVRAVGPEPVLDAKSSRYVHIVSL